MTSRNIHTKCNDEAKYLKTLINTSENTQLVNETKKQMTKILIMMRDNVNIDLNFALSDGIFTGNIGKSNPAEKIKYLLSDESTIREKVAAISNIIYDAVEEKTNLDNARKLYKYIMDNKTLTHINIVYKLIQKVTKNKHPENLDYNNNDEAYNRIPELWCPLLYAYPGYVFKRANINLHGLLGKAKPNLPKIHLIEDLSSYETTFLQSKSINLSNTDLPIETGMNLYGDALNDLKYYYYETDSCHIAGISGHSILHFTLGIIFEIDYRYTLLGQMLEMTPIHHSMTEICWAANDMGYIELFESYNEMRTYVNNLFTDFSAELRSKSSIPGLLGGNKKNKFLKKYR